MKINIPKVKNNKKLPIEIKSIPSTEVKTTGDSIEKTTIIAQKLPSQIESIPSTNKKELNEEDKIYIVRETIASDLASFFSSLNLSEEELAALMDSFNRFTSKGSTGTLDLTSTFNELITDIVNVIRHSRVIMKTDNIRAARNKVTTSIPEENYSTLNTFVHDGENKYSPDTRNLKILAETQSQVVAEGGVPTAGVEQAVLIESTTQTVSAKVPASIVRGQEDYFITEDVPTDLIYTTDTDIKKRGRMILPKRVFETVDANGKRSQKRTDDPGIKDGDTIIVVNSENFEKDPNDIMNKRTDVAFTFATKIVDSARTNKVSGNLEMFIYNYMPSYLINFVQGIGSLFSSLGSGDPGDIFDILNAATTLKSYVKDIKYYTAEEIGTLLLGMTSVLTSIGSLPFPGLDSLNQFGRGRTIKDLKFLDLIIPGLGNLGFGIPFGQLSMEAYANLVKVDRTGQSSILTDFGGSLVLIENYERDKIGGSRVKARADQEIDLKQPISTYRDTSYYLVNTKGKTNANYNKEDWHHFSEIGKPDTSFPPDNSSSNFKTENDRRITGDSLKYKKETATKSQDLERNAKNYEEDSRDKYIAGQLKYKNPYNVRSRLKGYKYENGEEQDVKSQVTDYLRGASFLVDLSGNTDTDINSIKNDYLKKKKQAFEGGFSKLGNIYVRLLTDDGDYNSPNYIPFQFNPEVSESGIAARYQAFNVLGRIGSLQTYLGTDNLSVTLTTNYCAVAKDRSSTDNLGWLGLFDIKTIRLIELGYRSLVYPFYTPSNNSSGFKYFKPPLIKVMLGENNNDLGISDSSPFSNFLRYPGEMLSNSLQSEESPLNQYRTFIAGNVTINKITETPYHLNENGYPTDYMAFSVTMVLVEVTPSYTDTYPNFKNYHDAIFPKLNVR